MPFPYFPLAMGNVTVVSIIPEYLTICSLLFDILREAEVALAHGMTVGHIYRQLSISEQTYYR